MKTIRLAEIFKLLIHLPKVFMMDFTAQNAVKFIKNTTLVLLCPFFVQDVSSVYFNFQKWPVLLHYLS